MIDLDKLSALEKDEPRNWRVSYSIMFNEKVAAIPFVNMPFDLFINVDPDGDFFGKEFPVKRAEFIAEMRNQLPGLLAYVKRLEAVYEQMHIDLCVAQYGHNQPGPGARRVLLQEAHAELEKIKRCEP